MISQFFLQLIIGGAIGIGAGYIGSFLILRRMALVGDALSHVALPGLALALLFNFNPFLGAFGALFIAIVSIWFLEKNTSLPSETLVGIFFTTALALGIMLTPEPELLEALFGNIGNVTRTDLYITLPIIALVVIALKLISKPLTLSTISKELTQSMKVPVNAINFLFLLMVAVIVALGIKVTGTLLMGALVIIPAAAARNVALDFSKYTLMSTVLGGVASIAGIIISHQYGIAPGPVVVLSGGVLFLISLLFKR
ncbi:MAG: metal ABC transporter permease [Candidatus Pacebacteria bacterium]|nr:metal ABC transporter permease [Candidatus Paceibacterota bacterium]